MFRFMNNCMSIKDVVAAVNNGFKVILIMRHADKEHLDIVGPEPSEELNVSEEGLRKSYAIGRQLEKITGEVIFYASSRIRAVMTAQEIARGMGIADIWNDKSIITDIRLSNSGFYYKNAAMIWKLFRDGVFYDKAAEYIKKGTLDGFNPMKEATQRFEEFILGIKHGDLTIIVSHYLIVSSFLNIKGIWDLQDQLQPLDSASIIISPAKDITYAFVPHISSVNQGDWAQFARQIIKRETS